MGLRVSDMGYPRLLSSSMEIGNQSKAEGMTEPQQEIPRGIWKPLSFRKNEFRILELVEVSLENGEQIVKALVHNQRSPLV